MGYHSAAFPPRAANPFPGRFLLVLTVLCLLAPACARGPKIEAGDWDAPSATPRASSTPRFSASPSAVAPGDPVATPQPLPTRRATVEPHFRPVKSDDPPVKAEGLYVSAEPLAQAPTDLALPKYELPGTSKELYLGLTVPRRAKKALFKATCTPPTAAPMVDSQSGDPRKGAWLEFSFPRPSEGWEAGDYRVEVSAGGKVLATSQVSFEAKGAPEEKPLVFPGVILSHLPNATTTTDKIPGDSKQVFLTVKCEKVEAGTPFHVSWVILEVSGQPKGKLLFEKTLEAPGESVKFTFDLLASGRTGFLPGLYAAELRVDGKLVHQQKFNIEASH